MKNHPSVCGTPILTLPVARGRLSRGIVCLGVLLSLVGCATSRALMVGDDEGGGFGFLRGSGDTFQLLQESAGLQESSWHKAGEALQTDDARRLWEVLARTEPTLNGFGPRRALSALLRQTLSADKDVPYAELLKRIGSFGPLVVMRPDGYLVSAITGKPLQRMGRVGLREGRLMAGGFEVGAFYRDRGGVFYAVEDSPHQTSVPVGELGLERDWFNAALDGAEDALGEMVQALARFVTEPVQSLEGLKQLPSAVAALIASSPDYFARYSALPLQDQIREAARLSTHLVTLYGSAAGAATRISSGAVRLPVLSLTAEGAVAVEQVVVPAGTMAAALGTGTGAVYVLTVATGGPKSGSSGGPGSGKRFSQPVKEAAEESAGGKCVFCGKETTRSPGPKQRNTDHAVPKSRGGNNTLDNAQNTCRTCNQDKGTKTTDEYLGGGR